MQISLKPCLNMLEHRKTRSNFHRYPWLLLGALLEVFHLSEKLFQLNVSNTTLNILPLIPFTLSLYLFMVEELLTSSSNRNMN